MIYQPSQYNVNMMKPGDIVYVLNRPLIYRIFRKFFGKDKVILKLRKDWSKENEAIRLDRYQEDCILLERQDLYCQTSLNNVVYYKNTLYNGTTKPQQFKRFAFSLYNMQMEFNDGSILTIPINFIREGLDQLDSRYKKFTQQESVHNNAIYNKFSGDYFKQRIKAKNIKQWKVVYCSICGEPIIFKFYKDVIKIDNKCTCGNNTKSLQFNSMTYDEFAVWYASQTDDIIKTQMDKFWT